MHHADIFCLLSKRKITLTSIAKEEGVSLVTVSEVVRGKRISYSVARAIAVKTQRSLNTLWPDGRYKTPSTRPLRRPAVRKVA